MYTQAMDTMGKDADGAMKVIRSAEEMRLQERFDAHIDAGDFIGILAHRVHRLCVHRDLL